MYEDTSLEIEKVIIEQLRTWPAWKKIDQVVKLTQACQKIALAGIRKRYPNADEKEIQLRFASLWIDRETMIKAFGWDPEKEGL